MDIKYNGIQVVVRRNSLSLRRISPSHPQASALAITLGTVASEIALQTRSDSPYWEISLHAVNAYLSGSPAALRSPLSSNR